MDMERILMIGGDEFVRDSLALTLEWAGYDVSEVASAREGLAFHLEAAASVVVVSDLHADEGGLEHILALRRHSPALPIIIISGTVPSSDQETKSLNAILGLVYRLQKPFTVDEFLDTIQTALPRFSHS
ncbi:MAG: response regulator [Nitrospirales bacterium]|nr:MAG: response regulator [Nitrospirales bacterium]